MKNNKNQEELQSRREFFKSAAKAALPVIGAVVLSALPFKAHASEMDSANCSACYTGCWGGCYASCSGSCKGSCRGNCVSIMG